jgi:uncharacterized protein
MLALRLSLVTLGVSDLAAATSFYEALGLRRSSASTDEVSFFEAGGAVLSLYGRTALARDAELDAEGHGFRAQSLAWNVGSPAEVDKAVVRMVAAGGGLVKPGARTHWGGYVGYVTDPDGHLWEVAHNPGFPFDGDGRLTLPD